MCIKIVYKNNNIEEIDNVYDIKTGKGYIDNYIYFYVRVGISNDFLWERHYVMLSTIKSFIISEKE